MMRKVIGVMPLYDREKKCYWIQPDYLEMLEAENAIPMLLPLTLTNLLPILVLRILQFPIQR